MAKSKKSDNKTLKDIRDEISKQPDQEDKVKTLRIIKQDRNLTPAARKFVNFELRKITTNRAVEIREGIKKIEEKYRYSNSDSNKSRSNEIIEYLSTNLKTPFLLDVDLSPADQLKFYLRASDEYVSLGRDREAIEQISDAFRCFQLYDMKEKFPSLFKKLNKKVVDILENARKSGKNIDKLDSYFTLEDRYKNIGESTKAAEETEKSKREQAKESGRWYGNPMNIAIGYIRAGKYDHALRIMNEFDSSKENHSLEDLAEYTHKLSQYGSSNEELLKEYKTHVRNIKKLIKVRNERKGIESKVAAFIGVLTVGAGISLAISSKTMTGNVISLANSNSSGIGGILVIIGIIGTYLYFKKNKVRLL